MNANVQTTDFGSLPDGRPVHLFTLTNANGLVCKVTDYGATVTELHVPDRAGKLGDVVLGFGKLEDYLKGHPFFGSTVGRVANRIANGKFTLEGRQYTLAVNNGPNHLHGGLVGFDKALWRAEALAGASIKFAHVSPDGDEGYPGTLTAEVTMALTDDNSLSIDYKASTDRTTIVNLTNHSYFNLAGSGNVLGCEMHISADSYTPVDANLIPTGEVAPVRGTPMDFTTPHPIGARIHQLGNTPPGYDHNYVINRAGKGLALAARVFDPDSGRVMEVHTTQPGVQFYTANFLDGTLQGKGGVAYQQHGAFCLETQHYPDSINHHAFPSIILRPKQTFHHETVHRFSTR